MSQFPLSRRFFLTGVLSGLSTAAYASAPAVSLRPQLRPERLGRPPDSEALIEAARLDGNVGYAVIDKRTGRVLESRNAMMGFPPASVTKAITALYALEALGA